jgi:hypothetical protein
MELLGCWKFVASSNTQVTLEICHMVYIYPVLSPRCLRCYNKQRRGLPFFSSPLHQPASKPARLRSARGDLRTPRRHGHYQRLERRDPGGPCGDPERRRFPARVGPEDPGQREARALGARLRRRNEVVQVRDPGVERGWSDPRYPRPLREGPKLLNAPALPFALIHQSTW